MELFGIRRALGRRNWIGHGGYIELSKIAYPLIIMSASNCVMQFVDRKFLAQNSTMDVAAALPAGILYFTMFCFFMVTCNFSSSLVAQYHGAGEKKQILRAVWAGLSVAIAAGLIITFLIPPLGVFILRNSGHTPELISREIEYFESLLPSGVFVCMGAPFFAFFSGQGRTLPVAVINIGACILNIFLDYALIFGKFGCPALGIFGAGLATSICCLALMVAIMIYFYGQKQSSIPTRQRWQFCPDLFVRLFRYGAPAGFQTFSDVGAFTLVLFMIGNIGPEALAASVIAISINNIFFIPLMGLADSTAIVVGQCIGRNRHFIAGLATFRAWRLAALYGLFGVILYMGFPDQLADFFAPDSESGINFNEVRQICGGVLIAAALFNCTDTVKFIFMGAMRGAGDTLAIFCINSFTAWCIMVPGVILFTKVWPLSIYLVWTFVALVGILDAMLFLWRFQSGKWRRIRLIEHTENSTPNL